MLTRAHATDFDEDKDIAHVPGMYVLVLRSLTLSVPVRSGISFSRNIGHLLCRLGRPEGHAEPETIDAVQRVHTSDSGIDQTALCLACLPENHQIRAQKTEAH